MKPSDYLKKGMTATLKRMPIEVPTISHGRPCYRWVEAFVVCRSDGIEIYPPMRKREAVRYCAEQGIELVENSASTSQENEQ